MTFQFSKYHGAGNDFILIDCRSKELLWNKSTISFLCDRHFGIGADGVLLLNEEIGFDFRMTYYNSDGSEATFCGNGGRCIVAFANEIGISKNDFRFVAADGEHSAQLLSYANGISMISLGMQDAVIYTAETNEYFLNTGTYHLVRFENDIENIDVAVTGKILRDDARFAPHGTNVNFVSVKGDTLFIRTYEKGVEAETLACGTGATAAAISASIAFGGTEFDLITRGGNLKVTFSIEGDKYKNVYLTGEAIKVFEGTIEL